MTSKIKVDNIENQCGGAVVTKCGGTTTISGSVVKSNAIQASDGGNLVSQSGTTITLGASGDTINLASGASQSGFGRTGTVDWQTGSIKTATFTAANGEGYFANTTGGAFTMNLPASPSAGNIVSVKDYLYTFATNNLTIGRNGSKIGGSSDIDLTLSINGSALTFVYVDATQGWLVINESTDTSKGQAPAFVTATGGTSTTCGNFKIHTFTGPGTFAVSCAGNSSGSNTVSYLVVAGGGGGGSWGGGGGGAGGYREGKSTSDCYTANPITVATGLPVPATPYPITVGGGGAGAPGYPTREDRRRGNNSVFSTITSTGGGRGGTNCGPACGPQGNAGGSGGGSDYGDPVGTGNSPPVSPPQGNPGGLGVAAPNYIGGGGGGAKCTGNAAPGPTIAGAGGDGQPSNISGSDVTRAGGGGGGGNDGDGSAQGSPSAAGGAGGGGAGGRYSCTNGQPGTTNTGGGGGAAGATSPTGTTAGPSGSGGSGIVIIRYKFQ
jgi:hypothetical protein